MIDLTKLEAAIEKVDKLFALGQAIARLANAHKKIIEKQYPDVLPPDLPEDFNSLLEDTEKPPDQ